MYILSLRNYTTGTYMWYTYMFVFVYVMKEITIDLAIGSFQ